MEKGAPSMVDASVGQLVEEEEQAPPALPTREEMRERIKAALADGRITANDVLADIYAAMYHMETSVGPAITGFFDQMQALSQGPIGRRLFKKSKQIAEEVTADGE